MSLDGACGSSGGTAGCSRARAGVLPARERTIKEFRPLAQFCQNHQPYFETSSPGFSSNLISPSLFFINFTPINIGRLPQSSSNMSNQPSSSGGAGGSPASPGQGGSPRLPHSPGLPQTPTGQRGFGGGVASPDQLQRIIGALGSEHLNPRPRPSWAYNDDEAKTSNAALIHTQQLPAQLEPRPDLRVYTCRSCIIRFGEKSTSQLKPAEACRMDGPRDRCNNCKKSASKGKCELVSSLFLL